MSMIQSCQRSVSWDIGYKLHMTNYKKRSDCSMSFAMQPLFIQCMVSMVTRHCLSHDTPQHSYNCSERKMICFIQVLQEKCKMNM